jgi:hypothetical protein
MAKRPWQADIPEEPVVAPEPTPEPPPEPTYPRPAKPVSVAYARVETAIFVDEFVKRVLAPQKPGPDLKWPKSTACLNVPAGIGKTRAVIKRLRDLIDAGKKIIIAVPSHILGEQIVRDMDLEGVARVYRGRSAADPDAPDVKMCLEPLRIAAIESAFGNVDKSACGSPGGGQVCDHYHLCHWQRQKQNPPKVWVVAHQVLFGKLPDFIDEPDVVIIDEAFYTAATQKDRVMHIDWLVENRVDKVAFRADFGRNMDNEDLIRMSKLARESLVDLVVVGQPSRIGGNLFGSLTAAEVKQAHRLELARKRGLDRAYPEMGDDYPRMEKVYAGQPRDDAIPFSNQREEHNRKVMALASCWEHLGTLLASGDNGLSPTLYFEPYLEIDGNTRPGIRIKSRRKLHEWVTNCDILHLDATANETIVRQDLPRAAFKSIDVSVPDQSVVFVQQLTDIPISQASISGDDDAPVKRRLKLSQVVELIAICHPGEKVVVICQEKLEKQIKKDAPPNVVFAHYGHLRGRNDLETARAIILIGRIEPTPRDMEMQARVMLGREVDVVPDKPPRPGKPDLSEYYDDKTRYLRMRDGKTVPVTNTVHPDEAVEAMRWAVNEAELIQAFYRARPLTRTGANPLTAYILTNVCLPIPVDQVRTWSEMQPNLFQLMMLTGTGGAPESPTHAVALFPELFPSVEAARKALKREPYVGPRLLHRFWRSADDAPMTGQNPVSKTLIQGNVRSYDPGLAMVGTYNVYWPAVRTIRYRRVGSRANRPSILHYDPTRIDDPIAWLRAGLGCDVVRVDDQQESER